MTAQPMHNPTRSAGYPLRAELVDTSRACYVGTAEASVDALTSGTRSTLNCGERMASEYTTASRVSRAAA